MGNKIKIHKESDYEKTIRVEMLSSMFEVPLPNKLSIDLEGDIDISSKPWNIGLIVGPSGSGKTLTLKELFSSPEILSWVAKSVIDDFPSALSMEVISRVCQSVGFNTIPSWLRPFSVLSNGEQFRCEVARRLLSDNNPITIDEFTSVVDRQVAQFACHAIQKYVREFSKRLVVASCHYDIINWLQPDWIIEPGREMKLTWRSLQRRPSIAVKVSRCSYETWQLFREFHYMSADLNRAARCYGLYVSTPGLETEHSHEGLVASTDADFGSGQSDSDTRVSSGLVLQQHERHSGMVLHQTDRIESQFPSSAEGSSHSREHSGSRNSRVSEESGRSFSKDESVDKLFTEEISGVRGPKESADLSEQNCGGYEPNEAATSREDGAELQEVHRTMDRPVRNSLVSTTQTYRIASLCGVLYRPHPRVSDIYGFTRMVTLPDFQGLGLAFVLACKVASAYKALGKRLHSYPNHPAWIRSYQRSPLWIETKQAGVFSPKRGSSSTVGGFGGRRCAVFMYSGPPMNKEEAERLINVETE